MFGFLEPAGTFYSEREGRGVTQSSSHPQTMRLLHVVYFLNESLTLHVLFLPFCFLLDSPFQYAAQFRSDGYVALPKSIFPRRYVSLFPFLRLFTPTDFVL